MPKNIVQDVVPAQRRRSIRDIQVEYNQRIDNRREVEPEYEEEGVEETPRPRRKNKFTMSKWILWIIGIISVLVLVFAVSNIFYGATVTITPKSKAVSINSDFTAKLKPSVGELGYTMFSLVREKEQSVPADAEQYVETRATGKIIIYNTYSTSPQRLVKNTRFETSKGLIYKISDSITIPGKTVVDGKTIPGSIEAPVFAESTGDEYNIGLTDFTVPGFKTNYERYVNFYAKSKTPMTGGAAGNQKTISDAKTLEIKTKLDKELLDGVLAEARTYAQGDLIFYPQAYKVEFESVAPSSATVKDAVTIKERAKFTAFIFKKSDLIQAVAQKTIDNFDGSALDLLQADSLSFTLDNDASGSDYLVFKLRGNSKFVWIVDKNKVSAALIDKTKDDLSDLVSNNSSIAKASAVIRPFWKNTFPPGPNKIKIEVVEVEK